MEHTNYHQTCVTGTYSFLCNVYGKGFAVETLFQKHLKEEENLCKFICDRCKKELLTWTEVKGHFFEVHVKHPSYQCFKCNSVFVYNNVHNRLVKMTVGGEINCKTCDELKVKKLLENHSCTLLSLKYECELCPASYSHKQSLYRHLQSEHEGKGFYCTTCKKQIKRQDNGKRHLMSKKHVKIEKAKHEKVIFTRDLKELFL